MLTQAKAITQLSSTEQQPGIINPSRNITADDELYLRDYELAAAVISWEQCLYGTSAEYQAENITNICISEDTVWYQLDFNGAYPLNIETFHTLHLEIERHLQQLIDGDKSTPKLSLTPEVTQPSEWRVVYDPDWDWGWYRAWVGNKCIGRYFTYEQAERAAQEYVSGTDFWSSHRETVLADIAA